MLICIPSYRRPYRQKTLELLHAAGLEAIVVIDADDDAAAYRRTVHKFGGSVIRVPEKVKQIGPKRTWIVNNMKHDKILMMDDDIGFLVRDRKDHPLYLRESKPEDLASMVTLLDEWLDDVAHAGVSMREGNNRIEARYVEVSRMCRVLAYRADVIREHRLTFGPYDRDDFEMTLNLLTLGFKNRVSYYYAQGQTTSNMLGGCSEYRNPEQMKMTAEYLASKFPEFVKVVQKTTKASWGGGTRWDNVIQWKRAYASAKTKRSPQ